MKLTLELDDGRKQAIVVEGLEPTLENMQSLCKLHKAWHDAQVEEDRTKDND
jgi:hypothetical protein